MSGNGEVDLEDAIIALQILSMISPQKNIHLDADLNDDGKLGMEEIVYIVQKIAELRD